ncbi:hypothetical protein BGM26_11385 [Bacillus sp. FJAT-29790]|uniref:LiaF transmembrane domain-containing protein n=1 Tax=Bacillus sp. FJAT-29790 TaxID=1895002 RepID=UPI001C234492|nr:DUF5668 domain-containing protein [Bacillus sp. FJAT-29790]MBU8879589.1 hypothetical protein [Bacillus sp. FJAT-29790]
MKNQRIFPGIVLIGFGAYFFLQQFNIAILQPYFVWPTLLMIVGIAFLFQGYRSKDNQAILPGVILTGFGLHFHVVNHLKIWPDHIGIFILIVALGLLLQYQKNGTGLFPGLLFLLVAALLLFYDKVTVSVNLLGSGLSAALTFWPILLILAGAYFLLKTK